jgi:hypothetical protein
MDDADPSCPDLDTEVLQCARRVELAQEELAADIEHLASTRARAQRKLLRNTFGWVLLGGGVLCGTLAARAVYRRFSSPTRVSRGLGRVVMRAAHRSLAVRVFEALCLRAVARAFPLHASAARLSPGRAPEGEGPTSPAGGEACGGSQAGAS